MTKLTLTRTIAACTPLLLVASAGTAQEYWSRDWLNTEYHQPTRGYEYEYESDGIDVDREEYEWEPGVGYHEQEWWDPSDWFDPDDGVDYEETGATAWDGYDNNFTDNDTYRGYGYDDTYYPYNDQVHNTRRDYGWHYDAGEGYDYGWHSDSIVDYDMIGYDYGYPFTDADVDYRFDRQISGEVVGLKRVSSGYGQPDAAVLSVKTRDGATRNIHLGDVGYTMRGMPRLERGDHVVIGGKTVDRDGREMFKAKEIRAAGRSYLVPEYEYRRRIEGELQGLRRVTLRGTNVNALVADVRTEDGERMSVVLGDPSHMNSNRRTIKPGTKVRVDGYSREVDGRSTFVVQDIKFRSDRSPDSSDMNRDRQSRDRQRQPNRSQQQNRPPRNQQEAQRQQADVSGSDDDGS